MLTPIINEKTLSEIKNFAKYTFSFADDLTKIDIEKLVAKLYNVNVKKVNVLTRRAKSKRVSNTRKFKLVSRNNKAIVTINPDQKIPGFDI